MFEFSILINSFFLLFSILVIAAVSSYVSERVGITNLGLDGMMCMGALFFGIYSSPVLKMSTISFWMMIFPLILTMISTMLFGLLHGFVCITLKSKQVIPGIAINIIGLGIATFVNKATAGFFYGSGSSKLDSGFSSYLFLGNGIYFSSILIFLIVCVLLVLGWLFVNYTKTGLRFHSVGENPHASNTVGINVIKYQWIGVLLSSALAGLAGALFLFNAGRFSGNVSGYGFLGIAIMVAGVWKIQWISLITVSFSLFTALTYSNILSNLGWPKDIVSTIPYFITIFVLIWFAKHSKGPEAVGIPFDNSSRF